MAPGLNLPPPTAGAPKGKQATVDDVEDHNIIVASTTDANSVPRFSSGNVILPPPDIRNIIAKTAEYIARLGKQFEERMRSEDKGGKLAFLDPQDPFHAYYQQTLEGFASAKDGLVDRLSEEAPNQQPGAVGDPAKGQVPVTDGAAQVEPFALEPERFLFSAELPSTTAVDLDVLKLTALFTATRGRSFASDILVKEGKSFQFEFLRPSHSLFPFFNRLVEQYRLVLDAPEEIRQKLPMDVGEPSGAQLDSRIGAGKGGLRTQLLAQVQVRAAWEQKVRDSKRRKENEEEALRAAFDEIDWQDFVIVQTVELTENDMHIDLPLPMSIRDVENMTLAQKKLASMIVETDQQPGTADDAMEMESGDEEGSDDRKAEDFIQVVKSTRAGDIKVRKNYQPKVLGQRQTAATASVGFTSCPVCGQQVPLNEMDEHVRIELLNPQFRDQRRDLEARQAQHKALQSGADPVNALRQYAGARTDIFGAEVDEQARAKREEEEQRLRRERERLAYDGHLASRTTVKDRAQKASMSDEAVRAREQAQRQAAQVPVIGPQISAPIETLEADASLKRSAEEPPADEPAAQRVAVDGKAPSHAGLPGTDSAIRLGQLIPESDWLSLHPESISLSLQLPDTKSVAMACDGRLISLQPMPPSTQISVLRDLVHSEILQSAIGASRIKFKISGKATTLKQSFAHWNLKDGSVVDLTIK
ncbi:hypothetical protein K437DRAFT_248024 [Tilletiaria anomala UBC 951]|uniref:SURP motif domain-containing protein n=1 Tax=Tilletiaria anomala (strain ATCC 24038 / CBS 436.72 / UBC 951) TaxID=1037660 RepID=A0A066W010_TILAU|nr:uncharacterized protein K437DRAFT_248024 [Tilletiaria anomala UBC 951]KDN44145.1 hypothetical protein K437DRAFT_248024 [Tilletiaria anomala UBC 951]